MTASSDQLRGDLHIYATWGGLLTDRRMSESSAESPSESSAESSSENTSDCRVCAQNLGEGRISPGAVIYQGTAWRVEHAYPSSLLGWLVIVLERHAEALHQLDPEEAVELGILQRAVAIALNGKFGTAKEYSISYGEAPRFSHLHVHIVPRAFDVDESLRGGGVFAHLRAQDEAISPAAVSEFCDEFGPRLESVMAEPLEIARPTPTSGRRQAKKT